MESILKDGYRLYRNKGGKALGVAEHSRVKIIGTGFVLRILQERESFCPMRTGGLTPGKGLRIWQAGCP